MLNDMAISVGGAQQSRTKRDLSSGSMYTKSARYHGLAPWQVARAIEHMRANFGDAIDLKDLCLIVGLSRFHFCTSFRHATGITPHQYLVNLRVRRAQELLLDASVSITEIGLVVGYQTPSSFAAAFRRLTGVTPSKFRRHAFKMNIKIGAPTAGNLQFPFSRMPIANI